MVDMWPHIKKLDSYAWVVCFNEQFCSLLRLLIAYMIIAVHAGSWPRTNSPQTGQPFVSCSPRTEQALFSFVR